MKALVACEESQEVTKSFRSAGHEAYSCDLQECSGGHPEWHIIGDAIEVLYSQKWDLVIAHPPCTYLANSGVSSLIRNKPKEGFEYHGKTGKYVNWGRYEKLEGAAKFFMKFMLYGKFGNKIAIENPIMHKYAAELIGRRQDQVIQPWMFGNKEQKATCLWLYGLPKLKETNNVKKEMMELPDNERQKIHYMPPGPERQKLRSKTFPGIAKAIVDQWANINQTTLF